MSGQLAGRVFRGCERAFVKRQYHISSVELTPDLPGSQLKSQLPLFLTQATGEEELPHLTSRDAGIHGAEQIGPSSAARSSNQAR